MTHRNAPLSVEGRRRLVVRCQTRPIAHVATEMGVSRACASKWVNRYRTYGEIGLHDRPSEPHHQPTATSTDVVARIEVLRRTRKWSASRIGFEPSQQGVIISRRTVSRHLAVLGLNRRRFIDPTGQTNRSPQRNIARRPGHMIHVDVKKVAHIPDGGGWRIHGKGSGNSGFCLDGPAAEATRRSLLERCVERNALLLPAHFPPPHVYRVTENGNGFAAIPVR